MIKVTTERVRRIMSTPYRRSWAIGDTVIAFRINSAGYSLGEAGYSLGERIFQIYNPIKNTILSLPYESHGKHRINRLSFERYRMEHTHFDLHVDLKTDLRDVNQYLYAIKFEDMTEEESAYVVTQRLQGDM